MTIELNLRFPDKDHVIVRFEDEESGQLPFNNPIAESDLRELQWYVEVYAAHSLGDPDDERARRVATRQPEWGKALFDAVFAGREAQRLFNAFQDRDDDARLLTISAEHPAILVLPWELLHDPAAGGGFLFMENPRISIRRRVAGATGGRGSFRVEPKDRLHLLFVVSRPDGTGFIDPRADALSVLAAIEDNAPGRVIWEFLRPPTLEALVKRLEDQLLPNIDILHFDGHGVFDGDGGLPQLVERARSAQGIAVEGIVRPGGPASIEAELPPNTGYLLFETGDRQPDFVSAAKLGANLHRHRVALVILSACQSAAVGRERKGVGVEDDRPMGSVAARLTATGIPSVLAMTHTVLVPTTRALFGQLYENLGRAKGIGVALDNARRYLFNHPKKYEVQRGPERIALELFDWFIPALYQPGADGSLLDAAPANDLAQPAPALTNLPRSSEAGFFGRRRELWDIERWFAGETRRITITGFGGQGKTALAQEAGSWLVRAGMFKAAVFVDYSRVQGRDAVAVAVGSIGSVLGESLIDAMAASEALGRTPTLVILDNLEALSAETLHSLLDAGAGWSTAGSSRLLSTTRRPEFGHVDYRVEGTRIHRRIVLDGLGRRAAPDDALEWFGELMKLPPPPVVPMPKREALVELFDSVRFHPLSLRVLAQQLKTRRPAELGQRLESLLAAERPGADGGDLSARAPATLSASLHLSLDSLDATAREILPRLGVFQGGAFEDDLLAITGIGDSGRREELQLLLQIARTGDAEQLLKAIGRVGGREVGPAMLAETRSQMPQLAASLQQELDSLMASPAELWPRLRAQLEASALVEVEHVAGVSVPYLRFHPTLAPMLWEQVQPSDRIRWSTAYRQRYYVLSAYLYRRDDDHPLQARAIAWRDLPNLVHAAHAALEAGDADAVDFADNVNLFLGRIFGLKQESDALTARAAVAAGEVGSRDWYLVQFNRGEQMLATGRLTDAMMVFEGALKILGSSASYSRAQCLGLLARGLVQAGRPDLAEQRSKEAIAICAELKTNADVDRLRGTLQTGLGDALRHQGKYSEAKQQYEESLASKRRLGGDERGEGVVLGQLGTLAMETDDLSEAAQRYRDALLLFQRLGEPAMEGVAWHHLGTIFLRSGNYQEAERHYRESARMAQERGDLMRASQSWHMLAMVTARIGKPEAAATWYQKAIDGARAAGSLLSASKGLNNLAELLRTQPGRLDEARGLAAEALALKRGLDPGASEIWVTHALLADIAEQEAASCPEELPKKELQARAAMHRQLARDAKRAFAGTRQELQRYAPVILGVVFAVLEPTGRQEVENVLTAMRHRGWTDLVVVLHRILDGERDVNSLCANLDLEDSMIVEAVLNALSDPSSLAGFAEVESSENS